MSDDLLFGVDDLERLKRGEQPENWLTTRRDILLARLRATTAELNRLMSASAPTSATPPAPVLPSRGGPPSQA